MQIDAEHSSNAAFRRFGKPIGDRVVIEAKSTVVKVKVRSLVEGIADWTRRSRRVGCASGFFIFESLQGADAVIAPVLQNNPLN
jgi:hypothetical protein